MTTVIPESGFDVTLPDGLWFRFEKLPTYRRLAGAAFKEMDFGWFDPNADKIILLELTNYEAATTPIDRAALLNEMVAKGRDCLIMLQGAWQRHGDGRQLLHQLPNACQSPQQIRLCFVIKAKRGELEAVVNADLQGRLNSILQAYARLLNVQIDVMLLDPIRATQWLPVSEAR